MDLAALIVAALSFCTSAWAVVFARSQAASAKEQARAAEDMLLIERDRHAREREALAREEERRATAEVTVAVSPPITNGELSSLLVSNLGPAIARQVSLSFEAVTQGEAPTFITGLPTVHVDELRAGATTSFRIVDHVGTAVRFATRLQWTDGRGVQSNSVTLSLMT